MDRCRRRTAPPFAALTLGAGRTTLLQGAAHLVIFAAFMLVSAAP
jgi:Ca2+:H+ antiporter